MLDDQTLFIMGFVLGVLGRRGIREEITYTIVPMLDRGKLLFRNSATGNCIRVTFASAGWMSEQAFAEMVRPRDEK